jgi:hypothetical protein
VEADATQLWFARSCDSSSGNAQWLSGNFCVTDRPVPSGSPTFFKSQLHNPISDNVNIVPDDTDNDSTARHDRPQLAMLDDRRVAIASPIASMQGLALGPVRWMDAMHRGRAATDRPRRTHRTPLAPGSNKTCISISLLLLALRPKCLAAPRDVPPRSVPRLRSGRHRDCTWRR